MNETDGNAAAGDLREVFAVDLTAATGRCAECGREDPLGEARRYGNSPGTVLRCRGCDSVLLRMVAGPNRTWLDLRGLTYLQIPTT